MYVHINNTSLHPSLLFFCLMKSLYRVGGEFAPHLKLVHYNWVSKTPFAGEVEKIRSMMRVRRRSGLDGPEDHQKTANFYNLRKNSHHVVAYRADRKSNTMLGYVQGALYQTQSLIFNQTAYKPADLETADMLIVEEICVIKQAQGQGIAGILLDECIRRSKMIETTTSSTCSRLRNEETGALIAGFENTSLTSVQFTVLSSNISSEIMFTKFAQRHGISIIFGCCHHSSWGNYIDWKVTLGQPAVSLSRPSHLSIQSNVYETYSMASGIQGYQDRQGVMKRVLCFDSNSKSDGSKKNSSIKSPNLVWY